MRLQLRTGSRLAAIVFVIAASVTACSEAPSLEDLTTLSNPFAEKEKRLPGERRDAVGRSGDITVDEKAAAIPVSISAPHDIGGWTQPGGIATNAPGNLALTSGGSTWSVSVARVERRGRLTATPIVYRGLVIVMDQKANLSAYSLTGGGRSWSLALKPEKEDSPIFNGGIAAEGGIIVAATGYGSVVGVGATDGGILWSMELGAPARSAPTMANGKAYVVSADNIVYAISIEDGSIVWSYSGIGSSAGVIGNANPAIAAGQVIVPYSSGEILSFEAETGEPKWIDALTGANRFTAVSGLTDVAAAPVVYEGQVFAISVSGRMIAVSLRDGNRLWAQNLASGNTPAVSGNTIFVATLAGEIVAVDRNSGGIRWIADLSESTNKRAKRPNSLAGPLLAGSQLWVGTSDGRIITLDPTNGSVVSTQTVSNPIYISPIAAGGRILVLDSAGKLSAF